MVKARDAASAEYSPSEWPATYAPPRCRSNPPRQGKPGGGRGQQMGCGHSPSGSGSPVKNRESTGATHRDDTHPVCPTAGSSTADGAIPHNVPTLSERIMAAASEV